MSVEILLVVSDQAGVVLLVNLMHSEPSPAYGKSLVQAGRRSGETAKSPCLLEQGFACSTSIDTPAVPPGAVFPSVQGDITPELELIVDIGSRMEQIRLQDQQQKDFLAFLFPDSSAEQHRTQDAHQSDVLSVSHMSSQRPPSALTNFTGSTSSFNQQPLDLMAMVSMQGMDASHSSVPSASTLTPQMLLEQQYKLTQLQQLQQLQNQIQNQIFQQQLALISGQTTLAAHDANPDSQHISPLTSPWLEAYQHNPPHTRPPNKRTASPVGDDNARVCRKRTTPTMTASMKARRNVRSATSTPLLRSSRGRRNSTVTETDSPSPVDLSMPPPAPPGAKPSPPLSVPLSASGTHTHEEARMTPVTPASIMNLGRLGISSGLAPVPQASRPDKSKEPAKPKESPFASKDPRKSGLALINPGPKPILPVASPTSFNSGSSAVSQPAHLTRKSHKDAEQKRRDSLKTAYDDLRVLLPPIPLPSDENFPDEPILPGALPPRGPPKAGGDGPNKGVSKLQLLRCGNDYIRTLKGRVERRDTEIAILRREVLRLRAFADEETQRGEDIDLEHDLDAIEANHPRLGHSLDEDGDYGEE
ncbi:hypothetical protein PAXRUDRAFT_374674 [Paxillus rubicundulus Ve08.2h10]|uniref:BHLH domain-containing protein n=1 Tax=Paxillus rubicundulus Ve08.2h10 TaxID=930991 RepID=A0A0D0DDX7_9AGAM|nr:hypothetical protein PAXRUDRAFT_374674 [Paxillus rubicundulus Ve08.2h10]